MFVLINEIFGPYTYSDRTKRFWKASYRQFHGKFLYFMGGPKNIGTEAKRTTRGSFNPKDSKIKFASFPV